ncbi:immediate early response gene 2 protein [Melanotaenia boesemani]|uniref:immediate early response gene 2 protein n=1 Tax=Melanotaenia boesemani TaxID=1250792 RepID=UPI001C04DC9D|nr:immediate early response gene 2 protein [Melanotaenia boesemani]
MEVSAEAKRIMVVALGKLYSSRTQRGGLRLHRSLLLTLVMKSARDIYHAAQTTVENVPVEAEQQQPAAEMTTEPSGAPGLQHSASLLTGQTSPHLPADAHSQSSGENKENLRVCGPTQNTRKRRGKASAEPDFLPCKKAKLEHGSSPQQLHVNSVLDYVKCSSNLGPPQTPIPLQTVIAAC